MTRLQLHDDYTLFLMDEVIESTLTTNEVIGFDLSFDLYLDSQYGVNEWKAVYRDNTMYDVYTKTSTRIHTITIRTSLISVLSQSLKDRIVAYYYQHKLDDSVINLPSMIQLELNQLNVDGQIVLPDNYNFEHNKIEYKLTAANQIKITNNFINRRAMSLF